MTFIRTEGLLLTRMPMLRSCAAERLRKAKTGVAQSPGICKGQEMTPDNELRNKLRKLIGARVLFALLLLGSTVYLHLSRAGSSEARPLGVVCRPDRLYFHNFPALWRRAEAAAGSPGVGLSATHRGHRHWRRIAPRRPRQQRTSVRPAGHPQASPPRGHRGWRLAVPVAEPPLGPNFGFGPLPRVMHLAVSRSQLEAVINALG